MSDQLPDFTLRITSNHTPPPVRTYILRRAGRVIYLAADETPIALANMFGNEAVELRVKLENAEHGLAAKAATQDVVGTQWSRNMAMAPKVECV